MKASIFYIFNNLIHILENHIILIEFELLNGGKTNLQISSDLWDPH